MREKGFKRIKYRRKHPAIADRVNAVNRVLKSADGQVRLKIDESCRHIIKSLEQTMYKKGSREVDKSDSVEHSADALGYCIDIEARFNKRKMMGVSL